MTVKVSPLLADPLTVTTTDPVVALAGTGATMLVALQLVGAAGVPLNVRVLDPWVVPKSVPVTVIEVPMPPEVGERPSILGANVNVTPLLACPATVTTTGPVEAPAGTGATILVSVQLEGVATVPLKVIVLDP